MTANVALTGTDAPRFILSSTTASDSADITRADATISVSGFSGAYDGDAHGATGTATGVDNEDLSSLFDFGASFTNVPGGTASWTFNAGYTNNNYNTASGTANIVINRVTPVVTATGGTFDYDTFAHTGTCSVTGVGGADLGPLAATHTPTDPPVNAGSYTVHCDYAQSTNYNAASDTDALTINRVTPVVTATGGTFDYDTFAHTGTCSVTGVGGADLGPLAATHTPTDPPVNAGSYTVHCDYAQRPTTTPRRTPTP